MATKNVKRLDARNIRFTHDSVQDRFDDGTLLEVTLKKLKDGLIKIDEIGKITVVKKDDMHFTPDNRQLWVFRQYAEFLERTNGEKVEVPVKFGASSLLTSVVMTTRNEGESVILLRDGTKMRDSDPETVKLSDIRYSEKALYRFGKEGGHGHSPTIEEKFEKFVIQVDQTKKLPVLKVVKRKGALYALENEQLWLIKQWFMQDTKGKAVETKPVPEEMDNASGTDNQYATDCSKSKSEINQTEVVPESASMEPPDSNPSQTSEPKKQADEDYVQVELRPYNELAEIFVTIDEGRSIQILNEYQPKKHQQKDGHRKSLVNRLAKLMNSTKEEDGQNMPEISNDDDSDSDNSDSNDSETNDSMKSVSTESENIAGPQRNDLFQSVSSHIQESPGANVPQTLAPKVSASETSYEDPFEEENADQNDDILRQKNHLKEIIKEMENGTFVKDEMHCDLTLWDFAGQSIFYATHQAFLSRRAIYLLVFDMSKQITDLVEDDIWHYDCQGGHKCKISEFIEFWLNSVHEFCSIQEDPGPPVILVGTFVDKLKKRSDDADMTFYNLRSCLLGNVANCHLTEEHFPVDNSLDEDGNIEDLRQYIVEVASEQSHWGESIPARWITLEDSLIRLKDDHNVKVIHMETLQEVNRQLPVPIKNEEELELFLTFHHEIGTILYYGDDDMKNDILLQPQWLIDAFKSLITAAIFCIRKQDIRRKWHEFDRSAILTQDLILLIWKEEKNSSYLAHKDLILRFMEKLGFVAKPKVFGELTRAEDFFLVPCMLKDPPPADIEELTTCSDSKQFKSTSKLCLTNHEEPDKRFIPSAAFNKLIAACINQWPLAMKNNKYRIYCGGAVFKLENMHFLYIFLYDHVIQIWVSRRSVEGHAPTTSICKAVKNQIKRILKEKVRMQREMLSFLKCPQATLYSNENMVVLQDDVQQSEILCYCQENGHVVSYTDLANCWLGGDRVQALNIDLDEKPTEKDFSRIALRIGKEYKQLAFQLGLSQPALEQIEMDHNTTADKITAVLNMWARRMRCIGTYGDLVDAMQDSGIDIAYVFKK